MKISVGIITDNIYLYAKVKLTLEESAEVTRLTSAPKELFDVLIADRGYTDADADITVGREGCTLTVPFTYDELKSCVLGGRDKPISISDSEKCVILHGKKIKLTDVEYSLFKYLYLAGSFVSKSELLSNVWESGAGEGVINVYIHYLREKLECGGEKIIICSRQHGYRIDEKYLRGGM